LVGDINSGLCKGGSVAHQFEKKVLVVREKGVAAHLGEDAKEGSDENSATHTLSLEHVRPRLLRVLHLNLDGGSDLGHLGLDEDGVGIAFSVVFSKNGEGFIITVFADKPTWALWQKTDDD
jgi:hypothetical protein